MKGNQKLIPVSVLFIEVFSYPYISFFHLLVKGFCVIISIIDDEEVTRISVFYWVAENDFHHLARPRNLSVDFKYDVLGL